MKRTYTRALGFAALLLWNCNESATRPESESNDPRVPAAVNTVTKYAALTAGYQISSEAVAAPDTSNNPFNEDAMNALKEAGLCSNFILLIQELFGNINTENPQSMDPMAASPRLAKVVSCLEDKSEAFGAAQPSGDQILDVVETCFCGGSGTLFFRNFVFTKYSAPLSPAGKTYGEPVTTPAPYSAPTLPGYSAPASPGGAGYSAPSL